MYGYRTLPLLSKVTATIVPSHLWRIQPMTNGQKAQLYDLLVRTRVVVVRQALHKIERGDTKSIDVPEWAKSEAGDDYKRRERP